MKFLREGVKRCLPLEECGNDSRHDKGRYKPLTKEHDTNAEHDEGRDLGGDTKITHL